MSRPERDRLRRYREKRSFDETPEPGGEAPSDEDRGRFVIQEHHARRLHWDLRLEREGVLVSWALPRGVPGDPERNRLAVHTEDHPLEYLEFHGEIPGGQYGAGSMTIWDAGTYEAEKWEDGKVIVRLEGERVRGRYSLFRTRGDDWMIHRMDPPEEGREPLPEELEPMRPTRADLPDDAGARAWEIAWDGERALAFCEPGHLRLATETGHDTTARYPEVRSLLEGLGGRDALLDGVVVAYDEAGAPSSERLARRRAAEGESRIRRLRRDAPVTYVAFDLLHFDGTSLLELPYEERRAALDALDLEREAVQVPRYHAGDGAPLLEAARAEGLAGIVGKRLDGVYEPGAAGDWIVVGA